MAINAISSFDNVRPIVPTTLFKAVNSVVLVSFIIVFSKIFLPRAEWASFIVSAILFKSFANTPISSFETVSNLELKFPSTIFSAADDIRIIGLMTLR